MDKYTKGDKIILGKYVKEAKIGEGAFGKVYRCRSKETGQIFALKKTRYLKPARQGIPSTTLEEINLRKKLRHPNLIGLISMKECVDKDLNPIQYLVYEYMESDLDKNTDLHSLVLRNTDIRPTMIKKLMYQLLSGLAYCHSKGVLHRNLRPSNLLINLGNGLLKIADFGLGRGYIDPTRHHTLNVVSPWYRAPEMLLGATHYSCSVDIWAVGCVFAEFYRSRPLFQSSIDLQIHAIFKILGTPNENIWPGVRELKCWHAFSQWEPVNLAGEVPDMDEQGLDLLSKMLQYDPDERISAQAAMGHNYFSELSNEHLLHNNQRETIKLKI